MVGMGRVMGREGRLGLALGQFRRKKISEKQKYRPMHDRACFNVQ